jgi:hypothetical protein
VNVVSVPTTTPTAALTVTTTAAGASNANNASSSDAPPGSGGVNSLSNGGEALVNVAPPTIPAVTVAEAPARPPIAADTSKATSESRMRLQDQSESAAGLADSDQDNTKANGFADLSSIIDIRGFVDGLNELRDEVRQDLHLDKVTVGSTVAVSTGFSIGYVLWLLRGEVLLSSLLASLPAWRLVDPLPVLAYLGKAGTREPDSDDSFESVIKKGGERPAANRANADRGSSSVTWRIVTEGDS